MSNKLLYFAISAPIILLLGIIGVIYFFSKLDNDVPEFFPLNNPKASYKITKGCPGAQGWEENNKWRLTDNLYCVEYRGDGVFVTYNTGNSHFFRITVGMSNIDLQPFLNKEVIITSGRFGGSSGKQCVNNKCTPVNLVTLDIYSLIAK